MLTLGLSEIYASCSSLDNPRIMQAILELRAQRSNPRFAWDNPRIVRIRSLSVTYIPAQCCLFPSETITTLICTGMPAWFMAGGVV